MRTVTKEEFDSFLQNYPRSLKIHCVGFCSPPHVEYYDWTLAGKHKVGTWEYLEACIVARVIEHSEMAAYGQQYAKPDEYQIN